MNIKQMKEVYKIAEEEIQKIKDYQQILRYNENEQLKTKIRQQNQDNLKLKDIIFNVNR